jgi:hypothetical protein
MRVDFSIVKTATLLWVIAVFAVPTFQPATVQAAPLPDDVISVNVAGVPRQFRRFFQAAEAFWDNEIFGYSKSLPRPFAAFLQERDLVITATMTPLDGVGGILGFAGPGEVATYTGGGPGPFDPPTRTWVIPRTANAFFDTDDFGPNSPFTDEQLTAIVIHEMAHALGFGALWTANGLVGADGNYDYEGFALNQYRRESGEFFVLSVPVEMDGGAGTAGAHWEDGMFDTDGDGFLDYFPGNFFNQTDTTFRTEYMLGSINTFSQSGQSVITPKFLSKTTLGSLEDIGWSTRIGPGAYDPTVEGIIKWGVDTPPIIFRPTGAPEPGSKVQLRRLGSEVWQVTRLADGPPLP